VDGLEDVRLAGAVAPMDDVDAGRKRYHAVFVIAEVL
jgi:hypothetical protein